jgi:5S rRNA maturation endonuclease (ribonuclease M5)
MTQENFKPLLIDYIAAEGIEINTRKNPPLFRCPSGTHDDNRASCVIYPERVYCPVCGFKGDVFDVASALSGETEFVKLKDQIREALKIPKQPAPVSDIFTDKKKEPPTVVKLNIHQARNIYSFAAVGEFGKKMRSSLGRPVRIWPYKDETGAICMVDVRFESPEGKSVISMYYDGRRLRAANCPHMIWGLDKLTARPKAPVVIVEGCKTAEALQEALPGWVVVTWNGGTGRWDRPNWEPVKGRSVCIWPDDDQPGQMVAEKLSEMLDGAYVVPVYEPARKLKEKGADAVEVLQLLTPGEVKSWILDNAVVWRERKEAG